MKAQDDSDSKPSENPQSGLEGEAGSSVPLDELVRASFDDALTRWNQAAGITPEVQAALDSDSDSPDASGLLAAAVTRAINQYLDENGLAPAGEVLLKPTPSFIASHGAPLVSVVLAAVEECLTSAITEQLVHNRTPEPATGERIKIDFSDLFDTEGP